MGLRVFQDRDGNEWQVWRVRPAVREDSPVHLRFREGWLCFQRSDGARRCRIPLDEVPPGWDALPDERLDLMRRVAEQEVTLSQSTTDEARQSREEDSARGEISGPRELTSPGDEPDRTNRSP